MMSTNATGHSAEDGYLPEPNFAYFHDFIVVGSLTFRYWVPAHRTSCRATLVFLSIRWIAIAVLAFAASQKFAHLLDIFRHVDRP